MLPAGSEAYIIPTGFSRVICADNEKRPAGNRPSATIQNTGLRQSNPTRGLPSTLVLLSLPRPGEWEGRFSCDEKSISERRSRLGLFDILRCFQPDFGILPGCEKR